MRFLFNERFKGKFIKNQCSICVVSSSFKLLLAYSSLVFSNRNNIYRTLVRLVFFMNYFCLKKSRRGCGSYNYYWRFCLDQIISHKSASYRKLSVLLSWRIHFIHDIMNDSLQSFTKVILNSFTARHGYCI